MEDIKKEETLSKETARIRREYERRGKAIPLSRYQSEAEKYLYQSRRKKAHDLLFEKNLFPLKNKKILEVGCGLGAWLHDFCSWGADETELCGIDLDPQKIFILKERLPASDIRQGSALSLPWRDGTFDLVTQATLFTSVLDADYKKKIADEMIRVLKPCGYILWYDFRIDNPFNRSVKGINLKEAESLYPNFKFSAQKVTLAPPLARLFSSFGKRFCDTLSKFSFLNTHYLILMQRGDS